MGKEDIDLNLAVQIIFSFSKWKTEAVKAHLGVMRSTRSMRPALLLWMYSACLPGALQLSRKESSSVPCSGSSSSVAFFFPSQNSHICASDWLELHQFITWAACLREVVIICVFEHKPWWDCTPCLKCLLFFWLFFGVFLFKEPHWSPLYPLMCPTGNSPVFKSTICCTKAYS